MTLNKQNVLHYINKSWEIENHYLGYLIDILGNDFQFPIVAEAVAIVSEEAQEGISNIYFSYKFD